MNRKLLLLCSLIAMGCTQTKSSSDVEAEGGYLSIDYPEGRNKELTKAVYGWMSEVMCDHFGEKVCKSMVDSASFREYYIQQLMTEKELLKDEFENIANYTDSLVIGVEYESDHIITYKVRAYSSIGDSHPMRRNSYVSFEKSNGKKLTFDDLVGKDEQKGMVERVFEEINRRKGDDCPEEFKVKSDEKLWHDPAVTDSGLIFYFHPGEVGSEAEGEYEVKIRI